MPAQLSRRLFLTLAGSTLVLPTMASGKEEVPSLLDHILLGCNDLDQGIVFVGKAIGGRAAIGGVHPGRGTRNALLSLGERRYLEIIAPDPAQPGATDTLGLRQLTEPQLVGWAAHPGDLDAFAKKLREAGIAFEGPTAGSRARLDGRVLHWKTLNLADNHDGLLPFFIEWSADTVHPSVDAPAGCGLARFGAFSPEVDELSNLTKLLGLDLTVERARAPRLSALFVGPKGSWSVSL